MAAKAVDLEHQPITVEGMVTIQTLVGSCIACLFVGALIGAAAVYTVCVRKKSGRVPSSPHYITAKPNHYVSVPANETSSWKTTSVDQPQSPNASLKNGVKNGIRNAMITALPLKDFETATIKRSSHGSYPNGHIRADLDSDNLFNYS